MSQLPDMASPAKLAAAALATAAAESERKTWTFEYHFAPNYTKWTRVTVNVKTAAHELYEQCIKPWYVEHKVATWPDHDGNKNPTHALPTMEGLCLMGAGDTLQPCDLQKLLQLWVPSSGILDIVLCCRDVRFQLRNVQSS